MSYIYIYINTYICPCAALLLLMLAVVFIIIVIIIVVIIINVLLLSLLVWLLLWLSSLRIWWAKGNPLSLCTGRVWRSLLICNRLFEFMRGAWVEVAVLHRILSSRLRVEGSVYLSTYLPTDLPTPNLSTNIVHFRGFDSSTILI